MKRLILLLLVTPLWAQLPTILQVQEALPCTATSGIPCTSGNPYATGVTRTNDNFTSGIPIADSDGINCSGAACPINGSSPGINLRLQNSAGTQLNSQFKVLANWPSGNVKWVLVDGQASPTAVAGFQDTPDTSNILCKVGTTVMGVTCGATGGNFGGSNLATDNDATITVSTGTATFTIKKANFDYLDGAVVNGKPLLASGSPGIVVMGPPANGATTCPSPETSTTTCNVAYKSSNDANSTAKIEENGPLKAVIEAEGALISGTETYMRFRVRLTFYKNSSNAAAKIALRNADEGASNSFASAYKGHASWSIQLIPTLGPSPAWTFGTDTTPQSGTFTGTESAYIYQAYSNFEESNVAWNSLPNCSAESCVVSPVTRTGSAGSWTYAQDGYTIVYNGAAVSGFPKAHTFYPQGWGDLTDGSGSGIEVGVRYLSAYWPKEIKFTSSLITIGLNPDQADWLGGNGIPYYQVWPDYHMETVYLSFHNGALASEANTFLAQQYQLIAKATGIGPIDTATYYNNAKDASSGLGALLYPLVSQTEQNSFWANIQNETVCAYNASTFVNCNPAKTSKWLYSGAVHDISPDVFRAWPWRAPGSGNQHEKNWGFLINRWLERGHTGAYLTAIQFYKYEMEDALPHSDVASSTDTTCNAFAPNFHFRCASQSYLDSTGFPSLVTSANASFGVHNWIIGNPVQDYEHAHWYGLTDYYFLTGDMFAYETMLQGGLDIFANSQPTTQQGLNANAVSRSLGHFLDGGARTYRWVKDVGDPTNEASSVLTVLNNVLSNKVLTADFCPSTAQGGWPGRCLLTIAAGGSTAGVSRTRGVGGSFANGNGDNNGGGDVNCPLLGGVGNQPCGKPWMDGIMVEGMYETYILASSALTSCISNPTLLFDLMDGIGNWADREAFIIGTTGTYSDTKLSYDVLLNGISPMTYVSSAPVAQYEFDYYLLGLYQGSLTPIQQERFVQNYIQWASSVSFNPDNLDDHDMYESSNVIYAIDHPGNTLSGLVLPVTGSPCTPNSSGQCTITWTAPTPPTGQGILSYRLKLNSSGMPFTEWIGYEPTTVTFTNTARGCTDPSTSVNSCSGNINTTPWFAGTEVSPAPANNVTSFTVSGLNPANTYTFGLKATFGTGVAPPPPPAQRAITTTQR